MKNYFQSRIAVLRDLYDTATEIASLSHNPVLLGLEKMGLVEPHLAAVVDYPVEWAYSDEDPSLGVYEETITFMLLEYPSGRRDWTVHVYGKNDELDYFDHYLRDVLIWTHGGPLPRNHSKPGQPAEVISLRVLKGE